ncbi:podocalyxin-like protein 2 [Myripristis murdjan]|uniref:podocalyxin-like protein 2 n=1 Tax=Myripristis murdjan TaxID=586833 RepID=UPI0011762CE9|nr:podocalyxin-like protein 2 [Myripristis murdjan]
MSTAADMPGLLLITLTALLASCAAFRVSPAERVIPFSPPVARLVQDEGPARPRFIQDLATPERGLGSVRELVRAQPHLVHDISRPQIHETSRSQSKMDSANSSQSNPAPSSASQDVASPRAIMDDNLDVEDDMERMVHLTSPLDVERYQGQPASSDPDTGLHGGPGAADASLEASGFYGMDTEDRGEEAGEDRDRRGGEERGEEEWEKDGREEKERGGATREERERREGTDVQVRGDAEANHTTPDLDALIGYSPSFHTSSSSPAEGRDPGTDRTRTPLVPEVAPLERELWEAEGEEEGQASGYGVFHSSITTTTTTTTTATTAAAAATAAAAVTAANGDVAGTAVPETDTGTDFGLLGDYAKGELEDEETEREEEEEAGMTHLCLYTQNPTAPEVGMAPSREPLQPSMEEEGDKEQGIRLKNKDEEEEEEWRKMEREEIRHMVPVSTDPAPTVGFTDMSWDWLEKTTPLQAQRSEVRGGGVTEVFLPGGDLEEAQQVVCIDWSELVGRGYVILNMTENLSCEEFRANQGVQLLEIMERVFARRMNSPEGSWVLYLSKPTHHQHQLLMNVASEHGVIDTKDVLGMLGEIRKSLYKVGIQNYSAASSCQSRPSQTRSDYGKLFVVLVIIGSVCMVIITSGLIYICWQRRLPATKTMSRAEELHFVENGCHDNPTLDVTNDSQPEMQEKKPSTNGLAGGGERAGEDNSRWQVFVNQAGSEEEEEEQDTHL